MMSDEYLVECNIDDDDDDDKDDDVKEIHSSPPPPPQFSSTPSLTQGEIRDPCGINKHLKVSATLTSYPKDAYVYTYGGL